MTYTLIIPIYNEERTLPALIKKLDRLDDNIDEGYEQWIKENEPDEDTDIVNT